MQGYVYAAWLAAAELSEAFGDSARGSHFRQRASELQERFEREFWCEELGTYALALDGDKRPCRVRTSNPGHCLWTGIAEADHGRRCGIGLLEDEMFSGWGIRTLATSEARYNPMSYHDGSIWPHDNALSAAGLVRYGLHQQVRRVLSAIFAASKSMDLNRLPELYCGFPRRSGQGPTRYPVACSPQAWSAAAVFLLLQACLGLEVQADPPRVKFTFPFLPENVSEIRIQNLRIGNRSIDLLVQQRGTEAEVDVTHHQGDIELVVEK